MKLTLMEYCIKHTTELQLLGYLQSGINASQISILRTELCKYFSKRNYQSIVFIFCSVMFPLKSLFLLIPQK